jgi:hypothetical protein
MRLNRRLTWRRLRDGLYRAANFTIERVDGMYGPRWTLTHSIGAGATVTVRRATLHECQSFAGMMAMEMPLFAIADVEDCEAELTAEQRE